MRARLHQAIHHGSIHPASNSVAKRTTNAVRAMLHNNVAWLKSFGRSFLTNVRNRTPTKALGGHAHYEMLYNMKLDIANLRALRRACAIVDPSEEMKNMDDWASMCVFVGYKYGGCGYRVWN